MSETDVGTAGGPVGKRRARRPKKGTAGERAKEKRPGTLKHKARRAIEELKRQASGR